MKNLLVFLSLIQTTFLLAQYHSDKYPDIIAETYVSDYFEDREELYGGHGLNYPIQMSVNKILGPNLSKWFVSLPKGSYVILHYTDNEIIDVPNKNDIRIIEHGCCQEFAAIYISHDGMDFQYLGEVDDCDNNELDLATIHYAKSVRYIKVVGLDVKCASPGFDLVSAYGINGANRNLYVGMDNVETFFNQDKTETTLILDNIYFETDSYELIEGEVEDLEKILDILQDDLSIKIRIAGHTDSRATESYNLQLSQKRSQAVSNYLISHGIHAQRIQTIGYGETQPLRDNQTPEGRAVNRRVEIRKIN